MPVCLGPGDHGDRGDHGRSRAGQFLPRSYNYPAFVWQGP